jgi:hypothetical protein
MDRAAAASGRAHSQVVPAATSRSSAIADFQVGSLAFLEAIPCRDLLHLVLLQ